MHPGLLRIRDRPGRTLRINNSGRLTGTSDMSGVREPRPARGCTQNAIWYLSAFRSGLEACVDEPLAMHDPIVIAFHVEELDARLHVERRVDDAPTCVAERNQSALPDQRTATLALFECGASVPLMVTQ